MSQYRDMHPLQLQVQISAVFRHTLKLNKIQLKASRSGGNLFTEIGRLAFLRPPLRGLGSTYNVHLGFIGKRVVDFLLVLIELFSLGVTAEVLQVNIS